MTGASGPDRISEPDPALARRKRWMARVAALALALGLAALAHLAGEKLPLTRTLEAQIRDVTMRWLASAEHVPGVVVIDIDEESLRRIGPWPWPRRQMADLVETLLGVGGARLVALDMVMPEPGRGDDGVAGDARLASLASQGLLVTAQAFDYVARDARLTVGQVGGSLEGPPPKARAEVVPRALPAFGHVGNNGSLATGLCVGNIGFQPDADGKARRIPTWTLWDDGWYPSFAMAIMKCADPSIDLFRLTATLPVDKRGQWAVPFLAAQGAYVAVRAADVIELADRREGEGWLAHRGLKGQIAVVGASALGLGDRVSTPLAGSTSGVTVHLAALTALMRAREGAALAPPPSWAMPMWSVASIVLLWWRLAGASGRLLTGGLLIAGVAMWAGLAAWVAASGALSVATAPLWGYAALALIHVPLEWAWTRVQLRRRTRLLSRYVARPVLAQLLAETRQDPLAPRRADITVLIADMQEYTRMTRESGLEEAARLTRGFLEALTGPVLTHRGTLDRYTGDGLVSFWGAPIVTPDHADQAVAAARDILENVKQFNLQRVAQGLQPVRARLGIASGPALVGDLGTEFRAAYTAVGDCINLASRLQVAARDLDVDVLLSEETAELCTRWSVASRGFLPVRGLDNRPVFVPVYPETDTDLRPPPSAPSP